MLVKGERSLAQTTVCRYLLNLNIFTGVIASFNVRPIVCFLCSVTLTKEDSFFVCLRATAYIKSWDFGILMQPQVSLSPPTACYCIFISPNDYLLINIWPNRLYTQGIEIALINAALVRSCVCLCVCVWVCLCVFQFHLNMDIWLLLEVQHPPFLKKCDLKIQVLLKLSQRFRCTRAKANKGELSSQHKPR